MWRPYITLFVVFVVGASHSLFTFTYKKELKMNTDEINKLLQLRQYLIDYYKTLAQPTSSTGLVREKDVGDVLSSAIKSIEHMAGKYVKFE
jgi:hypothetical protein